MYKKKLSDEVLKPQIKILTDILPSFIFSEHVVEEGTFLMYSLERLEIVLENISCHIWSFYFMGDIYLFSFIQNIFAYLLPYYP